MNKPSWLKIQPPKADYSKVKKIVKFYGIATVCQEAHCPNVSECWDSGTATFMIMGDTCTRGCKFCAVKTGRPDALDPLEPKKLAAALKDMKVFDYVVITSVDRDDLKDQGASHFANCIREIKQQIPGMRIEVLIPDFQGKPHLIQKIIHADPDVIAHNIETVQRLQKPVRDFRANYQQSLYVLEYVKLNSTIYTKTSLMLGLGEQQEEVIQTMKDLREIDCDIITFGQYLKPKSKKLAVHEFVRPETFKYYETVANTMGFTHCASGPMIRSSYKAGELFSQGGIYGKNC